MMIGHQTPRSFSITTVEGTRAETGNDELINEAVAKCEAGDYVLEETAYADTPLSPLAPEDLQSSMPTRADFARLDITAQTAGRTMNTLGRLGMHTYADILCMGREELGYQSRYLQEGALKGAVLGALQTVILRRTGHAIPDGRASSREQLTYFTDIRRASPALVFPTADAANYYEGLWFPAKRLDLLRPRIGTLETLDQQTLRKKLGIEQSSRFYDIIEQLNRRVVEPFEREKIHQQAQANTA